MACLKRQPRRDMLLGTCRVVELLADVECELTPDCHVLPPREIVSVPERETNRIAIVPTLDLRRVVEVAEEVHLLPRVVLVDIGPVPLNLVGRVLDAVYAPRCWMLGDAHAVSQAPAHQSAFGRVVVGPPVWQAADVEGSDLRVAGVELRCDQIHVL